MICQQPGIVLYPAFLMGFFSLVIAILYKPNPVYKALAKVQVPEQVLSADQGKVYCSTITSFPVIRSAAKKLGYFAWCVTLEDSTRQVLFLQGQIETSHDGYTNIVAIETTGLSPDEARERAD